mmetsp:Transcript_21258/g.59403  ORF Transcript_21258/g.59403 Transcript_21258/m.59403 type:complete len:295 (-) Transcript_21258:139-1023(-)
MGTTARCRPRPPLHALSLRPLRCLAAGRGCWRSSRCPTWASASAPWAALAASANWCPAAAAHYSAVGPTGCSLRVASAAASSPCAVEVASVPRRAVGWADLGRTRLSRCRPSSTRRTRKTRWTLHCCRSSWPSTWRSRRASTSGACGRASTTSRACARACSGRARSSGCGPSSRARSGGDARSRRGGLKKTMARRTAKMFRWPRTSGSSPTSTPGSGKSTTWMPSQQPRRLRASRVAWAWRAPSGRTRRLPVVLLAATLRRARGLGRLPRGRRCCMRGPCRLQAASPCCLHLRR